MQFIFGGYICQTNFEHGKLKECDPQWDYVFDCVVDWLFDCMEGCVFNYMFGCEVAWVVDWVACFFIVSIVLNRALTIGYRRPGGSQTSRWRVIVWGRAGSVCLLNESLKQWSIKLLIWWLIEWRVAWLIDRCIELFSWVLTSSDEFLVLLVNS